jgi:hypothetical protein
MSAVPLPAQPVDATLYLKGEMECGLMGRRFHGGFTATEKTELWDRWKRGESLKAIGRAFGKQSSSIYFLVAPHGGIRPAERRRSRLALTLAEREVISRGVTAHRSARSLECRFGSKTWQTSSLAGTLTVHGETQWDHYGLSVCARQRDLGYAALSASVAIGRPCVPSQARMMPASYALLGHDELLP